MDLELKQAATLGDVGYLKRALVSKPTDYFLSMYCPNDNIDEQGNIFHLAVLYDKCEFLREAMKLLPQEVVHQLLSQKEESDWTPLHVAAQRADCLEPVSIILHFFKSFYPDEKPWLCLTNDLRYPLLQILDDDNKDDDDEKCALELLSLDFELQCSMVDAYGISPLFLAVQKGFNLVAENILSSSFSYALGRQNGSTPLHFAPNTSENILRLLLEKHPDLMDDDKVDDKGFNVLHQWVDINKIWAFDFLLKGDFPVASAKMFTNFIFSKTEKEKGDSPLHTAARAGNLEIGQALVRGYQQEIGKNDVSLDYGFPPWRIKNNIGDTPLHTAIESKNAQLALYFLSIDSELCKTYNNNRGENPLLIAVENGMTCKEVVKTILKIHDPRYIDLRRNDGTTVLHCLRFCPEDLGKELLQKYWWLMSLLDDKGKTALHYAKQENVAWMVNLLSQPSSIKKQHFDWIKACERDENWAVIAFVDTCEDLQKVCREKKDTPLHHIKFKTYNECLRFLKMGPIAELKNAVDDEGATPLRRALERKDIHLVKALLSDDGVERNITDMDLLSELCMENDEWATMCKQINVNPQLKTKYIKSRTNLDQMRNTLSVVAALLATITFAAGFTLPGGLKSDTGSAMLAKKASFIVFLLADAYAMSTSMLVLFSLIWSMVTDNDMSYLLVDRSVFVLMQSLYGTMVAFMTGIYTVIEHSTLWVAIVIFVMCSLIGIAANRSVLHAILAKLIPKANKKGSLSQKKGRTFTSQVDGFDNLEGTNINQIENQNDDQVALLEEGEASTVGEDGSVKAN